MNKIPARRNPNATDAVRPRRPGRLSKKFQSWMGWPAKGETSGKSIFTASAA